MIDSLQGVLDKMQRQIEVNVVVERLRLIQQSLENEKLILKKIKEDREDQLLNDALKGTPPKP